MAHVQEKEVVMIWLVLVFVILVLKEIFAKVIQEYVDSFTYVDFTICKSFECIFSRHTMSRLNWGHNLYWKWTM